MGRKTVPQLDPGGGGINVAHVSKRLGGEVRALYCCGGPTGQILRTLLDAEGLTDEPFPVAGLTRESVTILETATNQQYRFVFPGPSLSGTEWKGWRAATRRATRSGSALRRALRQLVTR